MIASIDLDNELSTSWTSLHVVLRSCPYIESSVHISSTSLEVSMVSFSTFEALNKAAFLAHTFFRQSILDKDDAFAIGWISTPSSLLVGFNFSIHDKSLILFKYTFFRIEKDDLR